MIDDGLDEVRVSLNGSFGVLYPMGDIHTHKRDQQLPIKELFKLNLGKDHKPKYIHRQSQVRHHSGMLATASTRSRSDEWIRTCPLCQH